MVVFFGVVLVEMLCLNLCVCEFSVFMFDELIEDSVVYWKMCLVLLWN